MVAFNHLCNLMITLHELLHSPCINVAISACEFLYFLCVLPRSLVLNLPPMCSMLKSSLELFCHCINCFILIVYSWSLHVKIFDSMLLVIQIICASISALMGFASYFRLLCPFLRILWYMLMVIHFWLMPLAIMWEHQQN